MQRLYPLPRGSSFSVLFLLQPWVRESRSIQSSGIDYINLVTASTCNLLLMRMHEAGTGIEVYDKDKQVVGVSKVAAKEARELRISSTYLSIYSLV